MSRDICLRSVSPDEESQVKKLATSRTAPVRLVQRAQVIAALLEYPHLTPAEAGFRAGYRNQASGRKWVQRFNQDGLEGLEDAPRPGRPPELPEKLRDKLIALAQRDPESLGYSYAQWSLSKLRQALADREDQWLSTKTIWRWLHDAGLDWRQNQKQPEKIGSRRYELVHEN